MMINKTITLSEAVKRCRAELNKPMPIFQVWHLAEGLSVMFDLPLEVATNTILNRFKEE